MTSSIPDLFQFLHIDLNSFFASVEQQLHREFPGKATAVVGTMADILGAKKPKFKEPTDKCPTRKRELRSALFFWLGVLPRS